MKTDTVVIIDDNQMAVHALVKTTDWENWDVRWWELPVTVMKDWK